MLHDIFLCAGGSFLRSLPVNYCDEDAKYFDHELLSSTPDVYLKYFENICACGNGVLSNWFAIHQYSLPIGLEPRNIYRKRARLKIFVMRYLASLFSLRRESGSVWIADTWSMGYFHWMTDALPRLLAVQNTVEFSHVLLPENLKKSEYVLASLRAFGINNIRFTGNAVQCKSLLSPSHTAPTGNYNETLIKGLRRLYSSFCVKSDFQPYAYERIYISRSKALMRKIVNENECVELLRSYGFRILILEDYEFYEQVRLCLAAKHMVSNHGAGLTNMLFMRAGSSVLELRKKNDFSNNCYFSLASALDHRYFYQLCDSPNERQDPQRADLIVDCRALEGNLQRMLSSANGDSI